MLSEKTHKWDIDEEAKEEEYEKVFQEVTLEIKNENNNKWR